MILDKEKLGDEYKDGALIFYHSAKGLDAYKYFIDNKWRTTSGLYGKALYGNVEALWEDNFSHVGSATNQNQFYGQDFRFRIRSLRTHSLLFMNAQDGAKVIQGYSLPYVEQSLEDHGVPQKMIDSILRVMTKKEYASKSVLVPPGTADDDGTLLKYGFNGFVYDGNLDGKTVVFYNPSPSNLRFTGVSLDKGKTFIDIPKGTSWGQLQQIVEDYKNPKKAAVKTTTVGSNAAVKTTTVGSKALLSQSVLKYMDKSATSRHYSRALELSDMYANGTQLSTEQMIFIESWYIRFNLTHRRSMYPYVQDSTYKVITLSAYIAAYACVDSQSPVTMSDLYRSVDPRRLIKLLLPFSVKHAASFGEWGRAFSLLSLGDKFRPVLVTKSSTKPIPQLGRVAAAYFGYLKDYNFDISTFFGIINDRFTSDFGSDMNSFVSDLNSELPAEFQMLSGTDVYELGLPISQITSTGITT